MSAHSKTIAQRMLVFLLAFAMAFGSVPASAIAEDQANAAETEDVRASGNGTADAEEDAKPSEGEAVGDEAENSEAGAEGRSSGDDAENPEAGADPSEDEAGANEGKPAQEDGTVSAQEDGLTPAGEADDEKCQQDEAATGDEVTDGPLGGLGSEYEAKSIHDANESPSLSAQEDLPEAYHGGTYRTYTRNQDPFGTCWAFAATKSIEMSLLKRHPELVEEYNEYGDYGNNLNLSERQIAYFMFNAPSDPLGNTAGDQTLPPGNLYPEEDYQDQASYLTNGCDVIMVGLELASGIGITLEDVAPYGTLPASWDVKPTTEQINQMAAEGQLVWVYRQYKDAGRPYSQFLENTALDEGLARGNNIAELKDMYVISMRDVDEVKQAIMDYGGLAMNLYYDSYYSLQSGLSYYYSGNDGVEDRDSNHVVTLVGWDDNYEFTTFVEPVNPKPKGKGAWLCQNSWGPTFGEGGYFWVSYEDAYVSQKAEAVAYEMEASGSQNNRYQYDGANGMHKNRVRSGGSIANVFEAAANPSGETLEAVQLCLWDTNVDYSIQVYVEPTNDADPTSGTPALATPITGKTTFAGIYKLDVPEEVVLWPGQRYAVVATLSHADGTEVAYAVDASSEAGEDYVLISNVSAGQSFRRDSASSAWHDLASATPARNGDKPACCARIKAYTNNASLEFLGDVGNAVVSSVGDQTYTGTTICPKPTVALDGTQLREGIDYRLLYSDNVNVGTATVTVAGKGHYTGSTSTTFVIGVANISGATIAPINGRSYDGKPYEPKPKVMLGGMTLREGTDYTLTYKNNVYASNGKLATVTVTGTRNCVGSVSAGFEVWRNGQPMEAWAVARKAPVASLKDRDVTVEAPIHVAHAVSAGQPMEYRKVGGDSRLNVDVATGRVTVRKGTPAGTYKVTIRAIAFGGANYADGDRVVECKVQVVSGAKLDQDFQVTAADVSRTAASLAGADYLTRPFSVAMAAGNVTYKRASGSGCLDVDTMGRLKVARGTKAGTYYVKVWATAAGDAGYKPCTRTVTVKVVVR